MLAPAITLLTDFGTADGYVAEMMGVLVTQAPGVPLLDLSHDIPPQDIEYARLAVARYWRRFPVGTVHVVVVDPEVGSARAALAVESDGRFLVGPDNGVLSPALFAPNARVVALPVEPTASVSFHGRDVFAPAAAQLACGALLEQIGEPFALAMRRRTPQPRKLADGTFDGEVLTIDHFGNAITNLMSRTLAYVTVDAHAARVVRTYAEATPGELVALVGSSGFVELAVRDGNAAAEFGIARGQRVVLHTA